MTDQRPRLFFVHVRKTGGTTFMAHVQANFAPEERYPSPLFEQEPAGILHAKTSAPYLFEQDRGRLDRVRFFSLHLPFWVSEALAGSLERDLLTVTILRHPVERAVSHLKVLAQVQGWTEGLDKLYLVPWVRNWTLWNHQLLQFVLTAEDEADMFERASVLWTVPDPDVQEIGPPVVLDKGRLARARANLGKVEIVGITERFDAFVTEVGDRFGWAATAVGKRNVSSRSDIPKRLGDRIAADCGPDLDFYNYATRLAATA
ncbi:MAG: hypothetical protein WKF43_16000 [Acidimicrobiales bacterium]